MYIWNSDDGRIRTPSISFVNLTDKGTYEQSIDKLGKKSGSMFYNVHIELLQTYRIWNTFGKAFTRSKPVYVDSGSIEIICLDDMDIWSRALLTQAFVLIDTRKEVTSILKFEISKSNRDKEWQKGINPQTLKSIQSKISDLKSKGKGLKILRHQFLSHKNTDLYRDADLKLPQTTDPFEMGKLADYLEIASDILNTIATDHGIQKSDYMSCQIRDPNKRRIP